MTISVVGTGSVASAAVAALAASGHAVTVGLPPKGDGVGIVLSALDDDATLMDLVCSEDGLTASLGRGSTHVALGLHSAPTMTAVASAHASGGQRFVAAPVLLHACESAGPVAVVAGPDGALEPQDAIFEALRVSVVRVGGQPETASILALVHAALAGCAVQAMAEAFTLVRKYHVDPQVMHEVITDGLFGGSEVYRFHGAAMLDGTHNPGTLTVARALHMLDLVLDAADKTHVPLPSLDACRDRLLGAMARGDGERNWTTLYREQSRASGLD